MDWNTRLSQNFDLQRKNFQIWGSDLSQQLTATYDFSQTNAATPYSVNDQTIKMHSNTNNKVVHHLLLQNTGQSNSVNDQTIKMHSNTNNKVVNHLLLQNTGQSYNSQPIFPKTSVSATDFSMPQHLVDGHPVSSMPVSSVTVQMQDGVVQNPWPNSNIHVFPPAAIPGSTVNSVQSIPQKLYTVPVIYSNSLQKKSNSVRTSVYPQTSKSSSFSKKQSTPMTSYHLTGPPTPQACVTVPLNPALNNHLNLQQTFSCFIVPSGQNNQNQINGSRSSSAIAMESQQHTSDHVISTPCTVSTNSCRDATQVIPPVANINPPPPYRALPMQTSYGQLAQPVANASNENVQNHQNLALDQKSAEQNMQYYQKPQSLQSVRETNELGSIAYSVNEYRAADQPSIESAKPSVQVFKSLCNNNMQISTPQTTKTLVQKENLPNTSGKLNITKASLVMDVQKQHAFQKMCHQLRDSIKHKFYISTVENTKISELSAHNKSPNVSLPSPRNTTQNQTCLLRYDAKQVFKAPSQDAVLNRPLSLASSGSSQSQDIPLSTTKGHLYPILKELLQGTVDEDMLLDTYVAKAETLQNGHTAVQGNGSSSTLLVSGGDKYETYVKNNEETSRASPKTSPIVPTQEPLMGTKNSLGFEQPSGSTKNRLANISAVPGEDLLHRFTLNNIIKILDCLRNSAQNLATSNESSPSTKPVKECSEMFQCSAPSCPELLQQSKNSCLQTSEKSVTTWTSGSMSDTSGLALPVAKAAVRTPEAGIVQKPSMTGNCSLEELETSLALWMKNHSSPLKGVLSDSMEPTVSLSSKGDGDETRHMLENLPNTLTENDHSTVETHSVPSSLGSKLDTVSSNLLKGSEPQVAIVAPLIQSKESTQIEVQKKNLSTSFDMYSIKEEGSVHSLQELISTVPDTNRGISSMETCIAVKKVDSVMHQNEVKSDKNGMVKVETNLSYDCSFQELKNLKSQVSSGDEINCLNPVSHKSDPDLLKPGDATETELNGTVLQISSVCTLVQGDAFYNPQIANIFNTSPLKSSMKNDDHSDEHVPYPQQNEQQSTLLKGESETKVTASAGGILLPSQDNVSKAIAEKPSKDLSGLEMPQRGKISGEINVRNSEEEKSNHLHEGTTISENKSEQNFSYGGIYSLDLASRDQELSENQGLFSTTFEDSICSIKKENVQEHVSTEENHAQCSTNSESPVTLPNDQLTELLKEYPNGINDLEVPQKKEINDSAELTEREEGTRTCGQHASPSDTVDQIKITILNSPQRREYFPEHIQSSNKSKNSENNILTIDSDDKDSLSSDNISLIQIQPLKHIDSANATAETVVIEENRTYCCMQGFVASDFAVNPCSCTLTEDVGLKPQMDLQSKNMLDEKSKGIESYKTDCRQNNQLQISILHPVGSVSSGDQSNKLLKNTETNLQVKKSILSKVNGELPSFSSLEKLEPHKPKRTNELERKVLPLSVGSQSLKEEPAEIKINDHVYIREDLCFDQTLPHSSTNDLKKVAVQPLSKMESSHNERRNGMLAISKTGSHHHHCNMEIRHSKKYERHTIKHDTSETHMIKGPNRSSNVLKRQMTMERKHKVLRMQHSAAMNSSNLGNVGLASKKYNYSWHNTFLHSEEHLNRQKWGESKSDLEKNNETKRLEHNEPSNSEHAQPNKESIKKINLDQYAYSKERESTWKYKRSFLDNRKIPNVQKRRGHPPSIPKTNAFGKESLLDARNRDKRISKLTLQRVGKSYLNRVSFTQTAEESICLKKLEPSPSKSVWRMKSSEVPKTSSSSQQPEREKPQMLEFKMCPEILFRTSVPEEKVADSKKLPEKDKTPITAVKSKREDWLNYNPAKRRKKVESETQVNDHIPLDTALKLLDEDFHVPVKDSKTTFQTYRKMHLEKRSRSLDSSPIN